MTDDCCKPLKVAEDAGELESWQTLPQNETVPFIHRFETSQNKYVFDVNTRRILRVSPVVWDVLGDLGNLTNAELVKKHMPRYGAEAVTAALVEIADTQETEGLLLPRRPETIIPPNEEMVFEKLEHQREQLVLNVTEACNFRCSYCVFGDQYSHWREHSSHTMSWDVAKAAIDEFLAHSQQFEERVISFYGGEPLLNFSLVRRCVQYVRQEKQDNSQFAITTNGSLLTGDAARFLADKQFMITFSLDGPRDIHDRHRRTKNGTATWDVVVTNLRKFLDDYPEYRSNGKLRFNAVLTSDCDLCKSQNFWASADFLSEAMGLSVNEQKSTGDATSVLSATRLESQQSLYETFLEKLQSGQLAKERQRPPQWVPVSLFERPFVELHQRGYITPHLPKEMIFSNACMAGARKTFVNTDGEYYACERVTPSPPQSLGNTADGLSREKAMNLMARWTQTGADDCRRCWCLSHCRMGCFASAAHDSGVITPEDKRRACAGYRLFLHKLLARYADILEANPAAFDYTNDMHFQ